MANCDRICTPPLAVHCVGPVGTCNVTADTVACLDLNVVETGSATVNAIPNHDALNGKSSAEVHSPPRPPSPVCVCARPARIATICVAINSTA